MVVQCDGEEFILTAVRPGVAIAGPGAEAEGAAFRWLELITSKHEGLEVHLKERYHGHDIEVVTLRGERWLVDVKTVTDYGLIYGNYTIDLPQLRKYQAMDESVAFLLWPACLFFDAKLVKPKPYGPGNGSGGQFVRLPLRDVVAWGFSSPIYFLGVRK